MNVKSQVDSIYLSRIELITKIYFRSIDQQSPVKKKTLQSHSIYSINSVYYILPLNFLSFLNNRPYENNGVKIKIIKLNK